MLYFNLVNNLIMKI